MVDSFEGDASFSVPDCQRVGAALMLASPIAHRGMEVEEMRPDIERWESEGGRILPAEGRSKVMIGDGRGPCKEVARVAVGLVDHAAHRPTPPEPHSD